MFTYIDDFDNEFVFDSFNEMLDFIKIHDIDYYNFILDQLKEDYDFLNILLD